MDKSFIPYRTFKIIHGRSARMTANHKENGAILLYSHDIFRPISRYLSFHNLCLLRVWPGRPYISARCVVSFNERHSHYWRVILLTASIKSHRQTHSLTKPTDQFVRSTTKTTTAEKPNVLRAWQRKRFVRGRQGGPRLGVARKNVWAGGGRWLHRTLLTLNFYWFWNRTQSRRFFSF